MDLLTRAALGLVLIAACSDQRTAATEHDVIGQDGALVVTAPGTVVNQYAALAANVAAGASTLRVASLADLDATAIGLGPLAAGDQLMVIQMQGASIQTSDAPGYGTVTAIAGAGLYEVVTVAGVAGTTISIETDCGGLRNGYTTAGRAQVVRIPQLASLVVAAGASITGRRWDGARGGVIAVDVGGTATIDGAIDASAIGFRGGAADSAASANGVTTFRTPAATQGGEKGEGIAGDAARYDATFSGRFGRGAPANGGGGGDAHNAGGGGGANGNNGNAYSGHGVMDGAVIGAAAWTLDPGFIIGGNQLASSSGGGRGGYTFSGADQNALAVQPGDLRWGGDGRREVGGRGGRPVDNDPASRLFLGGGGGAGDGNNNAAGAGGAGGGVVLVLAGAVAGGGAIRANGAAGGVSNGNPGDAPGGGGAGGTIVVRAGTLAGIAIQASGGAGGSQTLAAANEAEGPGGGGGGGFIAVSGGAVARSAVGGAGGTTNRPVLSEFPSNGATAGASGTANAAVAALPVCVTANDPPVNTLPGAQATAEDAPLAIPGISIADPDAGGAAVQVTLAAGDATVTIGTAGLTFTTGDGSADAAMTFTGTIAQINAALAVLVLEPAADFNGGATLAITTNDLGNTGAGGPRSDSDTLAIAVAAVNDPPTARDDVASVAAGAAATAIDVLANDTSAPDAGELLVITSVDPPGAGATVAVAGDGSVIELTPAPGFIGVVVFGYTISDGNGGAATATVRVGIGADRDGDGLPDAEERRIGSDPDDPDSDDDGVVDGAEPSPGTDSDGDGLVDALDPDSDNDGLFDGTELGVTVAPAGTDTGRGQFIPDADPTTRTDPRDPDSDDGGVEDGAEDSDHDGRRDGGERNPNNPADDSAVRDRDGDGLSDDEEDAIGSDPDDADSDDDGVRDGAEPNYQADTDRDGAINALDPDSDGDGLRDGTELGVTTAGPGTDAGAGEFVPDADPTTTTSAVDPDSDRGGVSDGDEDTDRNGRVDPGERDPDDPRDDRDGVGPQDDRDRDGVADPDDNCVEAGNPDQVDRDGDGLGDACDRDADGNGFDDDVGVSGGGCAAGGGGAGGGPWPVVALVALLGWIARSRRAAAAAGRAARGRRIARAGAAVVAAAALAALSGTAAAQAVEPRNFTVERFALASDRQGLLGVEWAEPRGELAFDAALWIGYANDPLVVYSNTGGGRERIGSLVHDRTAASLSASLSPSRRFSIGFELPLVLAQSRGATGAVAPMGLDALASFGVGELRLIPKLALLRQDRHGIGLAVVPALILPTTSSSSDYLGDRGAGFAPELVASLRWTGWRLGANLGYRARRQARLLDLVVDDELFARAGVGYRFADRGGPPIGVDLTLSAATAAAEPFAQFNRDHLESLAGVTVRVAPGALVFAAGGLGLDQGFGTPDWRTLVGVRIGSPDRGGRLAAGAGRIADAPAPDLDGDGDGIADRGDGCPAVAEDLDRFDDADGCPDPDNDGDSLLDAEDVCPVVAGPADNQGCPDPDRDGDGVADRLDNCPDQRGEPDHAGCTSPQLVKLTRSGFDILDNVHFETDRAVIMARSYALLDNVAAVLRAHPDLMIAVEGHTDSEGDAAYNKKLSQRRADAVVAYLAARRIDRARLRPIGHGEEAPIADNRTLGGRARNRRVVFTIVDGNRDGAVAPR